MFRRVLVPVNIRRLLLPNPQHRSLTKQVHRHPKAEFDEDADFRPPWVYTWSRLLSYMIIPTITFYSVFIYDFGEREHVFQPARRWATKQKAAFFTLSPAEQKMIQADEDRSTFSPPHREQ